MTIANPTPGIEVTTIAEAMTTFEHAVDMDLGQVTIDLHPEGAYRVTYRSRMENWIVTTVRPCFETAIIDCAEEVYRRLA